MEATLPSFGVYVELDEEPTEEEFSVVISALSNGKRREKMVFLLKFPVKENNVLPQLHALLLQCWQQLEIPHKMWDAKIVTTYKKGRQERLK